jgi:hypothetical protein
VDSNRVRVAESGMHAVDSNRVGMYAVDRGWQIRGVSSGFVILGWYDIKSILYLELN